MGPVLAVAAVAAAFAATDDGLMPDKPPPVITSAANPVASKFKPINFTSIFDEISKDKLDIIKGLDGKLNLQFSNSNSRIDLNSPVQSRAVNTRLPAINKLSERASSVVALSEAMTRLGNSIEQMESTSPYLIEQNQEFINSFRTASESAIARGFDFRQYAIDQKLAKHGLDNSSTAFGVQVALAREKANAYSDLELKQAELAQGLKQQSLANLHQRGELLDKNAGVELNRFAAESQNQLANEDMTQKQAMNERQLELQNEEQRLSTEFANRNELEQRRTRMAELGLNAFNQSNQQAISAQGVDNNAIAAQNNAQYAAFDRKPSNPWKDMAMDTIGNIAGSVTGSMTGGANSFSSNPWNNPDGRTNNKISR
tara:strand:+ start:4421 stop:5533 length:1113 start_codon:yes stop_codon:yes gene_type:complete